MKTGPRYCKGQPHNDFSCLQMGDHYQRGGGTFLLILPSWVLSRLGLQSLFQSLRPEPSPPHLSYALPVGLQVWEQKPGKEDKIPPCQR